MKVTLVSKPMNAVQSICLAIAIMKEKDPLEYIRHSTVTQQQLMIEEIMKTRLRGALEFASFEFLIEGCSRTFTHQLVRHRSFHFSQQSMRFFDARESEFYNPLGTDENTNLVKMSQLQLAAEDVIAAYADLIDTGIPVQDARSILPQNITTKIMFGCNFRGLLDMAEVRMCKQTQGEFRSLMSQIKSILEEEEPFLASKLVPACERSGRCEFKSIYDRPCNHYQEVKDASKEKSAE